MKYLSLLFFLVFGFNFCPAQNNIIIGQVVDGDTGEPLAFCNVGWVNLNKGTVSGQNGHFSLKVASFEDDAFLRVSKMGYQNQDLPWADIKKSCQLGECTIVVELTQIALERPEFILENKHTGSSRVWGKSNRNSIFGLAYNPKERRPEENLGREIGLRLDTKGKNIKLNRLKISLSALQFEQASFRVNLYQRKDEDTWIPLPSKEDLIFQLSPNDVKGFEVDLSQKNIHIQGEFLLSIEWIDFYHPLGEGIITMTTGFPLGKSYIKNSSHDKWEEIKGAPSIQVSGSVLD